MKKSFSVLAALLALLSALPLFVSCAKSGAKIVEDAEYRQDWLAANRTHGVFYENPEYDPEDEDSAYMLQDETSPAYRTEIVRTRAEADAVFASCPAVDFGEEMLVVCCFTTVYHRGCELEEVKTDEGGALYIRFRAKRRTGIGDASMPGQGVVTIRMPAQNVTSVHPAYDE